MYQENRCGVVPFLATCKRTIVSWLWTVWDNAQSRATLASWLESITTITLFPDSDWGRQLLKVNSLIPSDFSCALMKLALFLYWWEGERTRTRARILVAARLTQKRGMFFSRYVRSFSQLFPSNFCVESSSLVLYIYICGMRRHLGFKNNVLKYLKK